MQPVVFNNRGHWYSNYYGHWYPNGLTNGVGVLSNGGNGGGFRMGSNSLIGSGAFGVPNSSLPGLPGGPGGAMPGGLAMPGAMPNVGMPGR
jgi:suppressor of tumorigenicity protein 13